MLEESIKIGDGWYLLPLNTVRTNEPYAMSRYIRSKSADSLDKRREFRVYSLAEIGKTKIWRVWGFYKEAYTQGLNKRNIKDMIK